MRILNRPHTGRHRRRILFDVPHYLMRDVGLDPQPHTNRYPTARHWQAIMRSFNL